MVMDNDALWDQIIAREGKTFRTHRGKDFSYHIRKEKSGELSGNMVVDPNKLTISRATVLLAFHRAEELLEKKGSIKSPGKLGAYGAVYLYPVFLDILAEANPLEKELPTERQPGPVKGIVYGVGVGPGDPELMTVKAVRLIKENDLFAVPGEDPRESAAYKIAVQAVPELADKQIIAVNMPMIKDRSLIAGEHQKGAKLLESCLDQGRNVVYLTLGDPTVYCSFSYLQHILEEDGYLVELVSGIPSFCAASARLHLPLGEWDEPIHIIPAVHKAETILKEPGTYVLMKSAGHIREIKEILKESGRNVYAVTNCGMEGEIVSHGADEIPDDAGYFTLIIVK